MTDQGLLEIAYELVVDRDFRERVLDAPEEVLADLGVSAEAYRTLAAVAPILLAGGIGLLDSGVGSELLSGPTIAWGR